MPRGKYLRTEAYRAKMSLALMGRPVSIETRKKISLSNIGKNKGRIMPPVTEETKLKISMAKMGHIGWNKGLHLTESHRENIRNSLIGKRLGVKQTKETVAKRVAKLIGHKCSAETREKLSNAFKGNNSHFWKGGKSLLIQVIRSSFLYRQWRSDIFTRDNFTCQWCGVRGGILNPDHIKPLSTLLQFYEITNWNQAVECAAIWDINNGRTLCKECHAKTSTYGHKAQKSFQLDLI